MARIRTIKPEFFRHVGLYEAEIETQMPLRIAFAGLWTAADREGRFKWRPRELKLDALPHDEIDFSRVMDALMTRGYLVKYEVDNEVFGFIPSWDKHQSINNRESESILPPPTEEALSMRILTRASRVDDACPTPLVHAPVEGKGRSNTRVTSNTTFPKPDDIDSEVWEGFVAHRKAKKEPITELVIKGIRREAAKAGWSVSDALRESVERGWKSFKAEWVASKTSGQTISHDQTFDGVAPAATGLYSRMSMVAE